MDVLIYVEDPGAANCVINLPEALAKENLKSLLLSDGHAIKYLESKQVPAQPMSSDVEAPELLNRYQPGLVLVGTSENRSSIGLRLIEQCRKTHIPSAGIVDQQINASERFRSTSRDPLGFVPDFLLLPDASTLETYVNLGFPRNQCFISGLPYFDHLYGIRSQLAGKRKNLRKQFFSEVPDGDIILTFISEPPSTVSPESSKRSAAYTLNGYSGTPQRTHIILEELIGALESTRQRCHLVVRLHPKDNIEHFKDYAHQISAFSHGQDPLPLLAASDCVIGMSSMLLQESAILGLPVMSILPIVSQSARLPCLKEGLVKTVCDRQQLIEYLPRFISECKGLDLGCVQSVFPPGALVRTAQFIARQLSLVRSGRSLKNADR